MLKGTERLVELVDPVGDWLHPGLICNGSMIPTTNVGEEIELGLSGGACHDHNFKLDSR